MQGAWDDPCWIRGYYYGLCSSLARTWARADGAGSWQRPFPTSAPKEVSSSQQSIESLPVRHAGLWDWEIACSYPWVPYQAVIDRWSMVISYAVNHPNPSVGPTPAPRCGIDPSASFQSDGDGQHSFSGLGTIVPVWICATEEFGTCHSRVSAQR